MALNKRLLVIPLAVALAAAGGIAWWILHEHESGSAGLTLYGNVDIRQVNLAFNASERIATMAAKEGEQVHKGQVLAQLDTERLQLAVDHAKAQVAAQHQVVQRLEAGSRPEEIRQARAQRDAAAAQLRNARANARRVDSLAARKLASPQQRDDARTAVDAAAAQLKAAEETLKLAVAGPRAEDVAAARETLKSYESQLALAKRNLADATLTAPADGVVQNRILEPGDMASPQTPVYTLALTDPIWVRAYVDEPNLGRVKPGMRAWVTTDTFPDKRYRAWVGYISPTAEFTPKAVETERVRTDLVYQVRVFVCTPHDELRLGMPATVHLAPGAATNGSDPCAGQ
ncbi:MAG: efflux RND transporter periplasmic adaptor subunit [Gammaproteobacteria bacterium]